MKLKTPQTTCLWLKPCKLTIRHKNQHIHLGKGWCRETTSRLANTDTPYFIIMHLINPSSDSCEFRQFARVHENNRVKRILLWSYQRIRWWFLKIAHTKYYSALHYHVSMWRDDSTEETHLMMYFIKCVIFVDTPKTKYNRCNASTSHRLIGYTFTEKSHFVNFTDCSCISSHSSINTRPTSPVSVLFADSYDVQRLITKISRSQSTLIPYTRLKPGEQVFRISALNKLFFYFWHFTDGAAFERRVETLFQHCTSVILYICCDTL